ncbi:unnamed protein product, partial [marine sediment metagenome]
MLRQTDCMKHLTGLTGGSLEANSGECFLVRGIFVVPSSGDTYLTVKINNFTVAYFRLVGKGGNHLGGVHYYNPGFNLMDYLVKRGLPFSLPIAEGQKLTVVRGADAGNVLVLYDSYDAGDIRADMPCGTASKTYGFLQYLTQSTQLDDDGDLLLDTTLTPAEFLDFPAGKACPANTTVKLHGIAGSAHNEGGASDAFWYDTHLKLVRDRAVLFDEDRLGIPFLSDADGSSYDPDYRDSKSIIGSGATFLEGFAYYAGRPPLMFAEPLVFTSGEELLVYVSGKVVG